MVKFFRKPKTMEHNLDAALELYCQGDSNGVKEKELKENIRTLNDLYNDICKIFKHDKIQNFVQNPSSNADREKFRKDFTEMKATMRGAILQGFSWVNGYAKELNFDEPTYRTLNTRFNELPSVAGGGRGSHPRAWLNLNINISSVRGEQIDAQYLEERFRILTISEIEREENGVSKEEIIKDIRDHIGILSVDLQKYAMRVLDDIENDVLVPVPLKRFMEYVMEYRDEAIRNAVNAEAEKFHLNADQLLSLYRDSIENGIDQIMLHEIENSADMNTVLKTYECSEFQARRKLHAELMDFIENRKAESEQG